MPSGRFLGCATAFTGQLCGAVGERWGSTACSALRRGRKGEAASTSSLLVSPAGCRTRGTGRLEPRRCPPHLQRLSSQSVRKPPPRGERPLPPLCPGMRSHPGCSEGLLTEVQERPRTGSLLATVFAQRAGGLCVKWECFRFPLEGANVRCLHSSKRQISV